MKLTKIVGMSEKRYEITKIKEKEGMVGPDKQNTLKQYQNSVICPTN